MNLHLSITIEHLSFLFRGYWIFYAMPIPVVKKKIANQVIGKSDMLVIKKVDPDLDPQPGFTEFFSDVDTQLAIMN